MSIPKMLRSRAKSLGLSGNYESRTRGHSCLYSNKLRRFEMAKLLEKPEELRVTANIEGTPLTISRNGKAERVTRIYQQWRVSEQLFEQENLKNYFRVRTSKGLYDIYRDMASNSWYLGRVCE